MSTAMPPVALVSPSICPTILMPSYNAPVLTPGWSAQLIATNLTLPRSLRFDDAGGLLVLEEFKGIRRLTFGDYGGTCLVVKTSTPVVDNIDLNHGLEFSADTSMLYASTANDVFAWPYNSTTGTVGGSPQSVITGMGSPGHISRTLLFSKDPSVANKATLLVSRGSNSNLDADTSLIASGRSQIRAFDVSRTKASQFPYDYTTDGTLIGWGLRNSVGLAEEPTTNGLYSVENSLDDIGREGTDIHTDNPGEELNYHGRISDTTSSSTRVGANFGYPTCFALWNATNFPNLGYLAVGDQFVIDTSKDDSYCATTYTPPRLTFQAHMAPLDMMFAPDGSTLYISFHGSWDRPANAGYKVSQVAFCQGQPMASSNSTVAAENIMWNADLSVCPGKCFRPLGLAMDSKGRIFVASDNTGEVYLLQKTAVAGDGESQC
ncbi:hypothetical protein SCUCBS95973_001038 [Sporothrix curviconia]|uniref:Pyrroloquinoline quinone-dependent pyranose dehydrogenase beta-propeller domain-containing protein n=1 Tax=Sporothrix curviconia TaxID=1260050 RepID=A0ABP0AV69_9PEZI